MKFLEALQQQIIVLDGAMGTMIQGLNLFPKDFGGEAFEMLGDLLSFSRPRSLKDIHLAYYRAGANAVETNTFGASPLRLEEFDFRRLDTSAFAPLPYGIELTALSYTEMAYYMNRISCEIARQALNEYKASSEYDGRPLYVIGSIGPSNYVLSPTTADLKKGTWAQIEDNFYHQVIGQIDGGVDVLLFETQQDILELKAAISGGIRAMREKAVRLPIMAQVTVDAFSRMQIFSTDIHAALTTIQDIGIDVFGINCSIGPDLMEPTIKKISQYGKLPISVLPNAGMPVSENGMTVYKLTPQQLADDLSRYVRDYGVGIVGGCCGTSPDHITVLADAVRGVTPARRSPDATVYISGPQKAIAVDASRGLVRIGERLNVRGSKKVRLAVENAEEQIDFDVLEEVAREQVKDLGVGVIDVCMDSNLVDTTRVLPEVVQALTIDFQGAMCLDSFDVEALQRAIEVYPGRPIINSISMEEYAQGVSKVDALLPVTAFHHPLYIALAAGPEGPAVTTEGKVQLARQIIDACARHEVGPDQLLMDIMAFPIGSESQPGMNFALESLNAIAGIKALHSDIKTTIGVSNLTNGLARKPYMRIVLTSVFLDEALKRGLDSAIVNPNHYVPVESLDKEDYELALRIIMQRDMDAFARLEEIALVKRGHKAPARKNYDELPAPDAIREKIKDGVKERHSGTIELEGWSFDYQDKIVERVVEALQTIPPLSLINDYLMVAMRELGDRFGAGEVSLPHLLKAADVMKQVMTFLESYMNRTAGKEEAAVKTCKAKIVLGTVYQDVHSIGKDLCKTLFENYGYEVIDLGVQVPLEKFVAVAIAEKADAVGMSALLVQTSNHMITVAQMMEKAGLSLPILIGGAPVNKRHAAAVAMRGQDDLEKIKGDVFYCPSAMDGVNVMESMISGGSAEFVASNREALRDSYLQGQMRGQQTEELAKLPRRAVDFERYTVPQVTCGMKRIQMPLSEIDLNRKALYSLNWKMGGRTSWRKKGLTEQDVIQLERQWIAKATDHQWLQPQGCVGFFPCQSEGDELIIFDAEDETRERARLRFDILAGKDKTDAFSPAQWFLPRASEKKDVVGLLIATAGMRQQEIIQRFQAEGDSESAHLLQGLGDRVAEDLAAMLHARLRTRAGVDAECGARYSPGIRLTEAFQFIPTSTTAAVVCFHPAAAYA
jgi:5-methyltetrahydrofolate--homocysteine methyltransferase